MWQTLLINLKLHLREKTQLFWLFAFPIILATMFNGMFGNIAESFELHTHLTWPWSRTTRGRRPMGRRR